MDWSLWCLNCCSQWLSKLSSFTWNSTSTLWHHIFILNVMKRCELLETKTVGYSLALLSASVFRLADISLRLKRQTTLASTFPLAVLGRHAKIKSVRKTIHKKITLIVIFSIQCVKKYFKCYYWLHVMHLLKTHHLSITFKVKFHQKWEWMILPMI